jgi:methyltransferase (TIGR00027 family)
MRTALIDAAVESGVRAGARQLVVLGAGLDSRAHRLDALADVVVFEVDHPSTQAFKRRKAQKLAQKARELRYAGCDFTSVTLEQALSSQGFDADAPTTWVWEGVTMYLQPAAVDATLATLSKLSTRGSTLIETYANPTAISRHNPLVQLSLASLAVMSEPIHFMETPDEMSARLARHGFRVLDDVFPTDAAQRLAARGVKWMPGTPPERVCVASKLSSHPHRSGRSQ